MNTAKPKATAVSRSLLNILLVLIEAMMTLVLRFDPKLRRIVYPLVKAETLVCLRTYLPHTQVYVRFTYKGILLDDKLPASHLRPHVTINAYTHELIAVVFGDNINKINNLQMHGNVADVTMVKTFLTHIGLSAFIQNLMQRFRGKPTSPAQKAKQTTNKVAELESKLKTQTLLAENLNTENKRLLTALQESKSRQQTYHYALIVISIVAIIAIVINFF